MAHQVQVWHLIFTNKTASILRNFAGILPRCATIRSPSSATKYVSSPLAWGLLNASNLKNSTHFSQPALSISSRIPIRASILWMSSCSNLRILIFFTLSSFLCRYVGKHACTENYHFITDFSFHLKTNVNYVKLSKFRMYKTGRLSYKPDTRTLKTKSGQFRIPILFSS